MTRLVHYAASPVVAVQDAEQCRELCMFGKPYGLWLSADDHEGNWRDWCLSTGWGLERLTHVHDVVLAPTAEVLHLVGAGELDEFTREFGRDVSGSGRRYCIDWPAVAGRWDGILIAPYVPERRLGIGAPWYYTWDAASGCVWNARAVASITLREVVPVPEPEEAD